MNYLKLLGIAIFALASSTTFAYQHGYYIAGNVGIFQGDFNNSFLDNTDVIQQNIAQLSTQQGYTGGLAVGYQQDYKKDYLLGGEFLVNADGQRASFQSGSSTTGISDTIQIQYHADLVFIPGIKVTESVSSYLKLGLSLAGIRDDFSSPAGYTPVITAHNATKKCLGFAAGLGASKSITKTVSVFTEANYHDYGTVTFEDFQNFSATYSHKSHIYSFDAVVGLMYQLA